MAVVSIRLKDDKRKILKIIAALEGKTIGGLVSEWIDEYLAKNRSKIIEFSEKENLWEIMKISESSFAEWNNDEDEIYNDL